MDIYVVHAFSESADGGNPAGVVFLSDLLHFTETQMQELAADLNFSETAFIEQRGERLFFIRYFTPVCEVPLCGHATIASFSFLRQKNLIEDGTYRLLTIETELAIGVSGDTIWMEMDTPVLAETPDDRMTRRVCAAFGLECSSLSQQLPPRIVKAGLRDLHICVKDHEDLLNAVQNAAEVSVISEELDVVGVHMSCLPEPDAPASGTGEREVTAYCSNYAPFCGIEEECATGTANAGLTFYLYKAGKITEEKENCFLQGEHMGRPSKVYSKVRILEDGRVSVWIGGKAVICEQRQK